MLILDLVGIARPEMLFSQLVSMAEPQHVFLSKMNGPYFKLGRYKTCGSSGNANINLPELHIPSLSILEFNFKITGRAPYLRITHTLWRLVDSCVLIMLSKHHFFLLLNKTTATAEECAKTVFDKGVFDIAILLSNAIFLPQFLSCFCLNQGTSTATT